MVLGHVPGARPRRRTVKALTAGKGGLETQLIPAVEQSVVEATIPYLAPIPAAMIRLQRYSGMRPGEVCALCPRDVSRSPKEAVRFPGSRKTVSALKCGRTVVSIAVPGSHKTLWRGKPRAIALGPQAQVVLTPFLDRPADRPCFSAREASDHWRAAHDRRAVYGHNRQPGDRYVTGSYGHVIAAAVKRANAERTKAGLPLIPHWAPNQLRHAAGSAASEATDRSHTQAFLGHSGNDTIDVYVEQELQKAAKVAAKIG
jgi:integrase